VKVPHSLFAIVAPFICLLSAVLLMFVVVAVAVRTVVIVSCHCLCLLFAGPSTPPPPPLLAGPLVFIFFLYILCVERDTHKGGKSEENAGKARAKQRTRMSRSNPLPQPLVKGKNLLYLIIIFLLTIRDAYSRNNNQK